MAGNWLYGNLNAEYDEIPDVTFTVSCFVKR